MPLIITDKEIIWVPGGKGPRFSIAELRHLRTKEGRALVAELCGGSSFYRDAIQRGHPWRGVMRTAANAAGIQAVDARLALAGFFDRLGRAPLLAFDDLLVAAKAAGLASTSTATGR